MTGPRDGMFSRRVRKSGYRDRRTGFTLFELLAAVIVIGLLATALLERLSHYHEYAEKTVMEATVRSMRNGLRLRVADLMMQDRMAEAGSLLDENPVAWLQTIPPNYIGELKDPKRTDVPPGSWYFDLGRQELVYLPNRHRFFEPAPNGGNAVRFRVTATKPHGTGSGNRSAEGLALTLLNPYEWYRQSEVKN